MYILSRQVWPVIAFNGFIARNNFYYTIFIIILLKTWMCISNQSFKQNKKRAILFEATANKLHENKKLWLNHGNILFNFLFGHECSKWGWRVSGHTLSRKVHKGENDKNCKELQISWILIFVVLPNPVYWRNDHFSCPIAVFFLWFVLTLPKFPKVSPTLSPKKKK